MDGAKNKNPSTQMKSILTLATLAAFVVTPVFAQDKPEAKTEAKAESTPAPKADAPAEKTKPTPEDRFKKLDKDGDGSLSIDEFRGKKEASDVEEAFKKLDANGDGKLSLEEFAAGAKKGKKKDK